MFALLAPNRAGRVTFAINAPAQCFIVRMNTDLCICWACVELSTALRRNSLRPTLHQHNCKQQWLRREQSGNIADKNEPKCSCSQQDKVLVSQFLHIGLPHPAELLQKHAKTAFGVVSKLLKNYSKTTRFVFRHRCTPSQFNQDSTHIHESICHFCDVDGLF